MSLRGLRNALTSVVPKWLQNRPGANVGFRFLYALIQPLDVMLEQLDQGLEAAWPGVGNVTALPLLGQSRGLIRGEVDTDATYAAKLVAWLDTWAEAGADERLAKEIQGYLGNTPMVRIINRAGFWVTLASDGTVSTATAAWAWDTISNPERNIVGNPWWSDVWIVVYPCEWAVTGATLSALAGVWGTPGPGTGHAVGRTAVDAILSLVRTWKGGHAYVQAIVWSYDPTLFDPAHPSITGDPDGHWGQWGKDDGSGNRVPARNLACRYWIPEANE